MKVRVILADDHSIVREGLRLILQQVPDLEIVGEAENGRTAVAEACRLSPDVVIMDISMSDLNGMEATRQIKAADPSVKVVALSAYAEKRYVLGMLEAGALGYVHKAAVATELVRAIQAVMRGRKYLSSEIAAIVVDRSLEPSKPGDPSVFNVLSPREREVLQLLAEGKSSKEIAAALGMAVRTVEVHRHNIMRKLDLHSVATLTKYAIREGLTSSDG